MSENGRRGGGRSVKAQNAEKARNGIENVHQPPRCCPNMTNTFETLLESHTHTNGSHSRANGLTQTGRAHKRSTSTNGVHGTHTHQQNTHPQNTQNTHKRGSPHPRSTHTHAAHTHNHTHTRRTHPRSTDTLSHRHTRSTQTPTSHTQHFTHTALTPEAEIDQVGEVGGLDNFKIESTGRVGPGVHSNEKMPRPGIEPGTFRSSV